MAETTNTRKKKFKAHDMIECRSFTNGQYFLEGKKSNIVYEWFSYGDVKEVEYQDLLFEAHARKPSVYKPKIIILDEDFLEQNKSIKELYDSMYTTSELKEILTLSPFQMEEVINGLPDGAKETLKGIAATEINNGSLDSVKSIKKLDEIFGTNLLFLLASE